jgi:hypothetical protein
LVWHLPRTHNGGGAHEKGLPGGATKKGRGQPHGGLVWFGAYLGLTMVAAHMKKASPEARRRKREASQGKVPAGAAAAPALVSSVQMIRPRLA